MPSIIIMMMTLKKCRFAIAGDCTDGLFISVDVSAIIAVPKAALFHISFFGQLGGKYYSSSSVSSL